MNSFSSREEAERAVRARASRDTRAARALYVCKDNNGTWLITTHPELFKDAYRVRYPEKTDA